MIQGWKLFFLLALSANADFDYCTLCEPKGDHTLCKYPDKPGPACNNDVHTDKWLTQAEKDAILKRHNELRADATAGKTPGHPAALNMKTLTWDVELELMAKRWALQCTTAHDTCRRSKDGTFNNQNHHISWHPVKFEDLIMRGIQDWYDEYKNYPAKDMGSYINHDTEDNKTVHYTILVWANTERIGCERIVWGSRDVNNQPNGINQNLVCDYGPGGNVNGEHVYEFAPGGVCVTTSQLSIVLSLFSLLSIHRVALF